MSFATTGGSSILLVDAFKSGDSEPATSEVPVLEMTFCLSLFFDRDIKLELLELLINHLRPLFLL